jgi:hypothetical protein
MILIPGFIISLLTFPGVIVHEWAHKIACNLFGVAVSRVVYFKLDFKLAGGEAGYVQHEIPKRYIESLCISSAPLFVNTLVALLAALSRINCAGRRSPTSCFCGSDFPRARMPFRATRT